MSNVRLLAVYAACQFLLFPIPIITLFWKDQIGMSLADIMVLQAIFGLAVVIFEFPSGYLADRVGYRRSILTGTTLLLAGWLLYTRRHLLDGGPGRDHPRRGQRVRVRSRSRHPLGLARRRRSRHPVHALGRKDPRRLPVGGGAQRRRGRLAVRDGATLAVLAPGAERGARLGCRRPPARSAANPRGGRPFTRGARLAHHRLRALASSPAACGHWR